jgi:hypothetical protein
MNNGKISPDEYERRKDFCDVMKAMGRSEYIEIARILRKHVITISENRSGMYFDMAKLPQEVFEELLQFRDFVSQTTKELEKRNDILRNMEESDDTC